MNIDLRFVLFSAVITILYNVYSIRSARHFSSSTLFVGIRFQLLFLFFDQFSKTFV